HTQMCLLSMRQPEDRPLRVTSRLAEHATERGLFRRYGKSALTDPAQGGLGLGRGLPGPKVLTITPGAAATVFVVAVPAGDTDHKTSSYQQNGPRTQGPSPASEPTRVRA